MLAGKHCESGDVIVRDALLDDPRPGDVIVTPATGAYGYAMATNYNGVPRPPVVFCSGGSARVVVRRETFDDLIARDVAEPLRIGLLGHGTVGAAFAALLDERAGEIERFNGRAPDDQRRADALARGDFAQILHDAELIVEVMGGIEPAREYLLQAMRAGRDVVSANKQLLSQHGEELFEVAREHGVRLRFEAAVAGAVPVVRLLEESLAATPIERIHGIVNGTTNFILSEMARGSTYPQALARGPAPRLRRGRPERRRLGPRRRGEDGDPRAAGVRRARAPR